SGIAELWTYGKHKGAPAGEFKVLVEKRFNEGEEEYIAAMNRHDEAAADKITVRSWSFVEVKFGDAAATPLTVNVDGNTKMLEVDVSPAVKTEIPYMK
ncbi:MAG: hypothetical protein LBH00_06700, partial [Planctomycetaceae bacterium]|nr:hypothetical protein [Planctomycetaceae bacterium]